MSIEAISPISPVLPTEGTGEITVRQAFSDLVSIRIPTIEA